jgi:hypothetical protein
MATLREVERKAKAMHSRNTLKYQVFGSLCLCQMEAGWTPKISHESERKKNNDSNFPMKQRLSYLAQWMVTMVTRQEPLLPFNRGVHCHAPSIRSHRRTKVVWPDFQPMRVPEEPVCINLFRPNPFFISLQLRSPVHVVPLGMEHGQQSPNPERNSIMPWSVKSSFKLVYRSLSRDQSCRLLKYIVSSKPFSAPLHTAH